MVTDGNCTYGGHLIRHIIGELLSCSSETNIMLYINYVSIKIIIKSKTYAFGMTEGLEREKGTEEELFEEIRTKHYLSKTM